MNLTFKQYGRSIVLVIDGKKEVLTSSDKELLRLIMEKGKTFLEKFEKTKSEKVKEKLSKSLSNLLKISDPNVKAREEKKLKTKIEEKKVKKEIETEVQKKRNRKKEIEKYLDSKIFNINENLEVSLIGFEQVTFPENLVNEFIGRVKKQVSIQPLLNFWYKCLLNPNEVARRKLFDYLDRHKLIITPYGNFVTYRMVKDIHPVSGEKLPEDVYTHAHSYSGARREYYKIGEIARLDRATECDEDGSRNCSKGLHTGSPSFIGIELGDGYNKGKITGEGTGTGYDMPTSFDNTFGNVAVICLVDPQHVVSIPNSDTRKMRSCELYFAKTTTPEEVLNHLKSEDYETFDSDYNAVQQNELKALLKDAKLKDYLDGKDLTDKRLNNLRSKLKDLQINNDIVNKSLEAVQIKKILEQRIINV